ncbi:hypothetical protein ACFO1V_01290 [Daeguia caeni]|uniref:AraC family transcriptional regulator n=1 Tax=Daeguia caeni TaxID=439612 RepID=A0ABV9H242_9HYPH
MKNNIKKKAASENIKPHDIFRYSAIKVEYTTESLSWPNLLIISAAMSPFKGEFAPVNNLLILMVVDGVMAGKWILDGETSDINLAPGELLIVPPDVYFSVDIVSECKLLALYVGQNILKELFVKYSTSGALFYSIEYNPHVRDDFLATIIFEMKKITECIDNFSLMNVQLLTRTVVGKIISNYSVVEYSNVDIDKKISVYKMKKY